MSKVSMFVWQRLRETGELRPLLDTWRMSRGLPEFTNTRGKGPAVLLVGGLGPTSQSCVRLQRQLVRAGFDARIARIDWNIHRLPDAVSLLDRVIDGFFPTGSFSLFAHSYGGIEVALLKARSRHRSRIEKIVTLATPFQGTPSDLLRAIFEKITGQNQEVLLEEYSAEIATIDTTITNIICPGDTLVPASAGGGKRIEVLVVPRHLGLRHADCLIDKRVAKLVTDLLPRP